MIIARLDGAVVATPEVLERVIREDFPGTVTAYRNPRPQSVFQVNVDPDDGPAFAVIAFDSGQLSCDGTQDQCDRVAVAVRATLASDVGRVVALSDDGSQYVELTPGITWRQFREGWTDVTPDTF